MAQWQERIQMAECFCHLCLTQRRLAQKAKWDKDQRQYEILEMAFTFVVIGGPAFLLGFVVCLIVS